MKRKAIQDFANVCCQMFLSSLSNSDRISLVVFGSGTVTMDFLSQRCTHNNIGISPLFYCVSYREWLEGQCVQHGSKIEAIDAAEMQVEVVVESYRNESGGIPGWLSTRMGFNCASRLVYNETEYCAKAAESQERGLGQLLHTHNY